MTGRWGLIGYGEAGRVIGSAVAEAGFELAVHDRALADPSRGPALVDVVRAAGGQVAPEPAGLAGCAVVLSLVTPATALDAARAVGPHLAEGALYVDLNSTGPDAKRAVAAALPGVRVVDGVMTGGGIRLDGAAIPISLAGPDAGAAAELLRGAGLTAGVVGPAVGAAAALKMLRSVVVKGMETLWVEALLAAQELDVVDPLFAMVEETLDRWPTRPFAEMLVTTHVAHAGRRSIEAGMARDTVAGTGTRPLMAAAVVALEERTARGLAEAGRPAGDVPATLAEALAVLRALPGTRSG